MLSGCKVRIDVMAGLSCQTLCAGSFSLYGNGLGQYMAAPRLARALRRSQGQRRWQRGWPLESRILLRANEHLSQARRIILLQIVVKWINLQAPTKIGNEFSKQRNNCMGLIRRLNQSCEIEWGEDIESHHCDIIAAKYFWRGIMLPRFGFLQKTTL